MSVVVSVPTIETTSGGIQEGYMVSESGLYALVCGSNKEGARRFRKWITSVVLPSIRKCH